MPGIEREIRYNAIFWFSFVITPKLIRLLFIVLLAWVPILVESGTSVCFGEKNVTSTESKKANENLTREQITKRIEAIGRLIRISVQAENEDTARQMGLKLSDLNKRTNLRAIEWAYERLLTAYKKKGLLDEEEAHTCMKRSRLKNNWALRTNRLIALRFMTPSWMSWRQPNSKRKLPVLG